MRARPSSLNGRSWVIAPFTSTLRDSGTGAPFTVAAFCASL